MYPQHEHMLTNARTHKYKWPHCSRLHITFSHTEFSLKIQGGKGAIHLLCSSLVVASLEVG